MASSGLYTHGAIAGVNDAPPACLYPQHKPSSGYVYGCRCARCRGWASQYQRAYYRAHHVPAPPRPPRPPSHALGRILARIEVDPGTGCWLWPTPGSNGYGRVRHLGRASCLTHRVVAEHYHGAIPPAHEVDHLCHVRACCNPDHLQIVHKLENTSRALTWSYVVGRAKLMPADARAIREAHAKGEQTKAELARAYGVSPRTIRDIVQRKTWSNVL